MIRYPFTEPARCGAGGHPLTAGLSPLARALLRRVWEEREVSRAELARELGLSRSTVTELVPALLATTLVAEAGAGVSSGGRRPILLRFQDDAFGILGVDMGATHVTVVLADLRGHVLAAQHRDHPVQDDPEGTRALIAELCEAALAAAALPRGRLLGIGVAVPSPVDPRHPERLHPLTLPAWRQEHRLGELRQRFGALVMIDNDANLGAVAEHWWGAARGIDDFTYLKLAHGVGAGHYVEGRIYRGATGVAGEAGHLSIDPRGPRCNCGNRGCLWTYVGVPHLMERVRTQRADHPTSPLHGAPLTLSALLQATLAEDPLAVRVVQEAGGHLGVAIVNLLNLFNPAAVIVGGSLARLGERVLAPIRQVIGERTFASAAMPVLLRTSELGEQSVAVGAATLVLDSLLHVPPPLRESPQLREPARRALEVAR